MSRAFVDEDAASDRDEEVAPLKLPLPPGARNLMTPAGAARQAAELKELQRVRRPALAAKAAAEPSPGPARRALGECDRRIAYLSRMQTLLEVVDPAAVRSDQVRFGATVTVRQSPEGRAAGAHRRRRRGGARFGERELDLADREIPDGRARRRHGALRAAVGTHPDEGDRDRLPLNPAVPAPGRGSAAVRAALSRRQTTAKPAEEMAARPTMIQNPHECSSNGMLTFIENTLTTRVGTMIAIVMRFSVFISTLRLLLTIEARASMRLAKMFEKISACL